MNSGKYSFRTIFRVFLKTGKKRIIITIMTGIVVFILLTAFFMSWFNYRYDSFYNYVEEQNDWYLDGTMSARTDRVRRPLLGVYGVDYLDLVTQEVTNLIETIVPGIIDESTASLHTILYNFQYYPAIDYLPVKFMCVDNEASSAYSDCLKEGRLPANSSELLYYPGNISQPLWSLNEIVNIKPQNNIATTGQNFTVVGILDNVVSVFHRSGFSGDIFGSGYGIWFYGDYDTYTIMSIDTFFTYQDDFVRSILNFTGFYEEIILAIDYKYQFEISHIRNLGTITTKLRNQLMFNTPIFDYLESEMDQLCYDLYIRLIYFNDNWIVETVKIFASSIPIIFLFGLVSVETFRIGIFEKESKFKLLKVHGLEFKTLRKMIALENLIITSTSFLAGFVLGTGIGYLFSLGMGTKNIGIYLSALGESSLLISLLVLFLTLFIGGFFIENTLAKKSAQTVSELYKRKRMKFIRRLFSTPEIIMLLIGLVTLAIGFTGLYFVPMIDYTRYAGKEIQLMMLFLFIAAIGALFVLISLFQLFTRLINLLWRFIGNKTWSHTKSFFTLSLKHLSIYSKNYQRTILAMFVIGLGITPGLIVNKSIDNQIYLESNLTVGCSDILVSNWGINDNFVLGNISEMEGVDSVIPITQYSIYDFYFEWDTGDRGFSITWLSIYNISEFLEVVDISILKNTQYDVEDIQNLEQNMSYMMSAKFAKENKFNKGVNYTSSYLAESQTKVYTLKYINSFDYFPLLSRSDFYFMNRFYDTYSVITSNETFTQILNSSKNSVWIEPRHSLLIKTTENANITKIREVIEDEYRLKTDTSEEIAEKLYTKVSQFEKTLLIIVTIITILATIFFGIITAQNIYYQRLRIIESEYQIGAKRYQMWGSFTIELLFIIILPLLASMAITIPLLYYVGGTLLNIEQVYVKFTPWLPWWLVIMIIAFGLFIITGSWLIEITRLVRRYRPIKQE
ncbi:MAG: ABC transporter permease [Candidatus Heimdallarchaeota archaeon]|nr:ABC transporter permease [Candidatus Heimdallarchaeota archaeon]